MRDFDDRGYVDVVEKTANFVVGDELRRLRPDWTF